MPRFLALEWDEHEARVAVAVTRGAEAVIEQAFAVELRPTSGETAPQDIGGKIGAALSARHVGRVDSLVAVGRPSIELRNLTLPPAPDDELPDMVRFQALREFNALGEDWPLDYLPISGSETEARNVLAAAISPELVEPIKATCQAAGLKPRRLVLRPCAAASLLRRLRPADGEKVRLLVDLLSDEADLTVMSGNQVVFLRTARLPSEGDHAKALLGEIRRTSVAVQNRLGGQRVEAIYLCGDDREHGLLAEQLSQDLGLPAEVFDPFAGLEMSSELRQALPAHTGRFAPLLGMLLDEAAATPPALDFLNPRRRPPPVSHRRKLTVGGSIAAGVLFLLAIIGWWHLGRLDAQIKTLTEEANKLAAAEKVAVANEKKVADIDKWASGELVWIDELAEISKKLPPAKDVILSKLSWGPRIKGAGGELSMQCFVRSPSTTELVEQSLRDARHHVDVEAGHEDSSHKGYQWKFDSKIAIDPQGAAPEKRPLAAGAAGAPVNSNGTAKPAANDTTKPAPAETAPRSEKGDQPTQPEATPAATPTTEAAG